MNRTPLSHGRVALSQDSKHLYHLDNKLRSAVSYLDTSPEDII
jgi:hypothetical protein